MREIILLLFGSLICSICYGQQKVIFPVVLKNVIENGPFDASQKLTRLSDTVKFQGLPDTLKEFRIKELNLLTAKEKLFILYGITKQDRRLVLFDADFNRDFAGEKVFLFDYNGRYDKGREKAILDSITAVEIRFPNSPSIYVKPNVYNCCVTYKDSSETNWHLFVSPDFHREGEFSVNGQIYKMALSGSYTPFFQSERSKFFVVPASQPFDLESGNNRPGTFENPAQVNEHAFILHSLSKFGDTAWVQYRYKEKVEGSSVGLYAKNINTRAINEAVFDLKRLKGRYVLLDFWGTWCKPCIALLPELRQLNQKYEPKGLVLVSIAEDGKESYGKLTKMLKDFQMNWTNLFDDQELKGNIANQYEVDCFPTSLLINPEGKIIFRGCGSDDFEELKKKLAEVLL